MREKFVTHPTFIPFQPFTVSTHVLRISAAILFLLMKLSYWHVRVPSRVTFLRREFHGPSRVTFFRREVHGPYRVTFLRPEVHGPYRVKFFEAWSSWPLQSYIFWDVKFMALTELHFLRREVHERMNGNLYTAHKNFHTKPCVFTAPDALSGYM